MNHPYGPPGYGGGNPQYCGRRPNYLPPQAQSRTVDGGTAITAGVLGIVLGVFCIGRAVIALVVLKGLTAVQDVSNMAIDFANTDGKPQQHVHIDTTPYYVGATIGILVAALFITGGAMLLNRRTGGRILLAVMSGLGLLAGVGVIVLGFVGRIEVGFGAFIAVPIAAVTLYMTLCRSTGQWCAAPVSSVC
jgi:hypothetical protein